MLTKACTYAIHAMMYIALNHEEGINIPINRLADELQIPFHFTKKILQQLGEQGLLKTQRSAKGGVALAKDADDISIMDIIRVIDGDEMFTGCVLGLPGCGEKTPCPMHEKWSVERMRLFRMFNETTLRKASANIKKFELRIGLAERQ